MSSRYDYRDPGTDPDYCDPLTVIEEDEPETADEALARADGHLVEAVQTMRRAIAEARTADEQFRLRQICQDWEARFVRLNDFSAASH